MKFAHIAHWTWSINANDRKYTYIKKCTCVNKWWEYILLERPVFICYVEANLNEVFTVQCVYARSIGLHCNPQFIFKLCFARTLHLVRVCMKTIQNRAQLFILVLLLFFSVSFSFFFVATRRCSLSTEKWAPHLLILNISYYKICGSLLNEFLFGTFFSFSLASLLHSNPSSVHRNEEKKKRRSL